MICDTEERPAELHTPCRAQGGLAQVRPGFGSKDPPSLLPLQLRSCWLTEAEAVLHVLLHRLLWAGDTWAGTW